MILSDGDIVKELQRGSLRISPIEESQIQSCSVDLHLSKDLKTLDGKDISLIGTDLDGNLADTPYKLQPKEFILGSTEEYFELPPYLCGQLEGRSTSARMGLMCHITAGFIDSGYFGNITLELYNASDKPIELRHGDSICQILFHVLTSDSLRPYGTDGLGSKYQGSEGTVRAKKK